MADTINFDPLSQTSYFLNSVFNGQVLANGTCFFVEREGNFYLITNWHNVTGKNPISNEWLSYSAVAPEQLRVKIYKNQDILELVDFEINLYDNNGNKVWLEHPVHFQQVDVIAIKVSIPDNRLIMCPETFIEPFNENTKASIRDDVFILGYPFGLSVADIFPIWKRASIASEPVVDIDNLPKLYVDTATRPGMSGSPVVYKERRMVGIGDGVPGEPNTKFSKNFMQFVGIYSGRIGDDEMKAQLGIKSLLTYVRLLLYIREIGAEDLLVFRQKRPACETHLEQHLKEVGLDSTLMLKDELIEKIADNAEIYTEVHNEHLDYTFIHPEFEHTVWGSVKNDTGYSTNKLQLAVTKSVVKRYLAALASDIYTSQILGSPLGSTINFHGQLLNTFKAGLEEADVAFHLKLPIIEGISPDVLLKIRNDEKLHFEKFRQSLRLAIKERLKNASSDNVNKIAEEIRSDIIEPSLNDIELRLKAAKSAATKKAGLSLTLGAFTTTVGLLTANPFLVAAGAGPAVGYSISAGQKLLEEMRDISLSDMYFLWQAQEHSKMH